MAYVYPNFKTKKAFKDAVSRHEKVVVKEQTPLGEEGIFGGIAYVEGPHHPEPHTWYAKCKVKEGRVIHVY